MVCNVLCSSGDSLAAGYSNGLIKWWRTASTSLEELKSSKPFSFLLDSPIDALRIIGSILVVGMDGKVLFYMHPSEAQLSETCPEPFYRITLPQTIPSFSGALLPASVSSLTYIPSLHCLFIGMCTPMLPYSVICYSLVDPMEPQHMWHGLENFSVSSMLFVKSRMELLVGSVGKLIVINLSDDWSKITVSSEFKIVEDDSRLSTITSINQISDGLIAVSFLGGYVAFCLSDNFSPFKIISFPFLIRNSVLFNNSLFVAGNSDTTALITVDGEVDTFIKVEYPVFSSVHVTNIGLIVPSNDELLIVEEPRIVIDKIK
ncbi:hypothetical protein P9112_003195 [Eukaryota sp. TZLM1-RC]